MELEEVLQQLAEATDQVADRAGGQVGGRGEAGRDVPVRRHERDPGGGGAVAAGGSYRRVEPETKQRQESETKAGGGFGVAGQGAGRGHRVGGWRPGRARGGRGHPDRAARQVRGVPAGSADGGREEAPVRPEHVSTGATAYYTAENAAIPVSEQTFAEAALLAPKELTALVPVSNRLLRDADDPNIETIIREDLAEVLALRADLAFLKGTGTGEPRGIVNTPGVTAGPDMGAAGGTPTFGQLKEIPAALRAINAPFRSPGWIFHPRLLSTLEQYLTMDGLFVADQSGLLAFDETGGGGTLCGFPFATTTQLPINRPSAHRPTARP